MVFWLNSNLAQDLTLTLHCSKSDDDNTSTVRGGACIDITNYSKISVSSGTLYFGTSYTGYTYTCSTGNTYDIASFTGNYIFHAIAKLPASDSATTVTFTLSV